MDSMDDDWEYQWDKEYVEDFFASDLTYKPGEAYEIVEPRYFYAQYRDNSIEGFYNHLSLAVYEITHDGMTKDLRNRMEELIELFDNGRYDAKILPKDVDAVRADIEIVRAALEEKK